MQMREQYGFGSIKFKGGVLEPGVEGDIASYAKRLASGAASHRP